MAIELGTSKNDMIQPIMVVCAESRKLRGNIFSELDTKEKKILRYFCSVQVVKNNDMLSTWLT